MPPKPSADTQAARRHHPLLLQLIAGALLTLIVLVGIVVLISWLFLRPRKLEYTIEQGSVSGYNLTKNNSLNANFQFVVRANNRNRRISMHYDKINATVLYEDQELSTKDVHPFYQPRRNVTHLALYLTTKDAAMGNAAAQDLRLEWAAGKIPVDIRIRANIRLKTGVFMFHRKLTALCGSVAVPFNSSKGFEKVFCEVCIVG